LEQFTPYTAEERTNRVRAKQPSNVVFRNFVTGNNLLMACALTKLGKHTPFQLVKNLRKSDANASRFYQVNAPHPGELSPVREKSGERLAGVDSSQGN
jgi:hypothetical protein